MLHRLFVQRRSDAAEKRGGPCGEIVAFLFAYLLLSLFPSLAMLLLSPLLPSLSTVLSLLFTSVAILPLLLFLKLSGREKAEALYFSRASARPLYLLFLPLGMGLLVLTVGILVMLGAYGFVGASSSHLSLVPLLFLAYLVQGSAEELLCRGFLMSSLCASYGGVRAALISAAVFSFMHIFNPAISVIGLVNIFLFGLVFASITQKTGSILPPSLLHAGWNFSVSLFGVQISGTEPSFSVFMLERRKHFLSGGAFGPEGSPVLTGLLVVSLFVLLFLYSRVPARKDNV